MSKKKSSPKKSRFGAIPALIVGATLAGATFYYVKGNPAQIPADEKRVERLPEHQDKPTSVKNPGEQNSTSPSKEGKVIVRTPKPYENEVEYNKQEVDVKEGENKYLVVINGFLKGSRITPKNAVATSAELDGSILKINFTKSIEAGYGTEDERVLIDGICRSAGQFPEVKQVLLLLDGQSFESFGSVDLTQPLDVLRD